MTFRKLGSLYSGPRVASVSGVNICVRSTVWAVTMEVSTKTRRILVNSFILNKNINKERRGGLKSAEY